MNKDNEVFTFHGVLFTLNSEGNSAICVNGWMGGHNMLNEISHRKTNNARCDKQLWVIVTTHWIL